MDSLTQLALGAAVGGAVAGHTFGRKAMLWGAVCGTLPDLDVFISFGDPVSDFTYHRSFSHSLFVLAAVTPLLAWLAKKIHPSTRGDTWLWTGMIYLVFATHVLLDSLTVYGTQIFWPFITTPVGWSTIFIIDPLYTLPLLTGILFSLALSRQHDWRGRANTLGLLLSSVYLGWSVAAKWHVENTAAASLTAQGIQAEGVLTVPAPFNTLLWRILAVDENYYYEGFYSILDNTTQVSFIPRRRQPQLLDDLAESPPVKRLQWFTRGFYKTSESDGLVVISDLRMGLLESYVFQFAVGLRDNERLLPISPQRVHSEPNWSALASIWQRIWHQHTPLLAQASTDVRDDTDDSYMTVKH